MVTWVLIPSIRSYRLDNYKDGNNDRAGKGLNPFNQVISFGPKPKKAKQHKPLCLNPFNQVISFGQLPL